MKCLFVVLFMAVMGLVAPAMAYVGPGLGVVAIWALLGPVAAIIVTVLLIAYFPLRYFYKKRKHKQQQDEGDKDADSEATDEDDKDEES